MPTPPWWGAALLFAADIALVLYLTLKGTTMPMPTFNKELLERAVKTTGQVAGGIALVAGVLQVELDKTSGKLTLVGVAAVLSALSSLASRRFGDRGTASAVSLPPPAPPA